MVLGGLWIPDIAAAAGARAVGVPPRAAESVIDPRSLSEERPALLVLALPDVTAGDAAYAARGLTGGPLAGVPAFAVDGRRYVNVPGPSVARSVELLAFAAHGLGPAPTRDELILCPSDAP